MSQKIIFLKGLPASGKSTWAKQYCLDNPDFVRINKDDIRIILGNLPFSREFENQVLKIQRDIGLTILDLGKSLIVDDTNFADKHYQYWNQISISRGIIFDVRHFNTPVEECIRRDSQRQESVGKEVILNMYRKYIEPYELKQDVI